MSSLDLGSFLLGVLVVMRMFVAIDLLVAGGGMSMGMIGASRSSRRE
jgi:flagellar biosynthesis protein FliP